MRRYEDDIMLVNVAAIVRIHLDTSSISRCIVISILCPMTLNHRALESGDDIVGFRGLNGNEADLEAAMEVRRDLWKKK